MSKKSELGQFYTPQPIADFMVNWVLEGNCNDLLDPAAGDGIFLLQSQSRKNLSVTAYEIDPQTVEVLKENCSIDAQIHNRDYLESFEEHRFSAIVCNPPYNKFQKISQRKRYIEIFKERYGVKLSGYSNLCVYFLVKSINELKESGRCCYIVPYEFLNTGYGEVVKKYMLKQKILKHIIKFDSNLKLFEDAMTTSCILCMEKKDNDYIDFISVSDVNELNLSFDKGEANRLYIKSVDPAEKWLKYFPSFKIATDKENLINLSSVVKVKRGIATGCNKFFSLSQDKIDKNNLSPSVCIPCITKSHDILCNVLTQTAYESLVADNKNMFIFDGTKATTEDDFDYIKFGERLGVNKTYLNSHRNLWYQLENREPAPILISVFSRERLKVVRNEANVKNLTTFHGIYFKDNVSDDFINLFYCYLLTPVAQEILKNNKREYAEGLDKFEPNDLNNAFILNIYDLLPEDKESILNIYKELKADNDNAHIKELDNIFKKYI